MRSRPGTWTAPKCRSNGVSTTSRAATRPLARRGPSGRTPTRRTPATAPTGTSGSASERLPVRVGLFRPALQTPPCPGRRSRRSRSSRGRFHAPGSEGRTRRFQAEYAAVVLAVVLLVAPLVTAIFAFGPPTGVRTLYAEGLCRITEEGDCDDDGNPGEPPGAVPLSAALPWGRDGEESDEEGPDPSENETETDEVR